MLLSQNSGTEYFVDDIVICSQGFYTRNLFWTWAPFLPHIADMFLSSQCENFTSRRRSEFILCFILKWLCFCSEVYGKLFPVSHVSCLCVGKNEVALLYNWLEMFRLSASAWNLRCRINTRIHCVFCD
jgi:hypothetical protein